VPDRQLALVDDGGELGSQSGEAEGCPGLDGPERGAVGEGDLGLGQATPVGQDQDALLRRGQGGKAVSEMLGGFCSNDQVLGQVAAGHAVWFCFFLAADFA